MTEAEDTALSFVMLMILGFFVGFVLSVFAIAVGFDRGNTVVTEGGTPYVYLTKPGDFGEQTGWYELVQPAVTVELRDTVVEE